MAGLTGERMKKDLTRQQHLDLYYYMRLNRAVEDTMVKLFRQNKIVGGLYSSLGQEAISVGTAFALEKKDWLAPMIRNIGALLVKGVPPRDIFTQHMAKYTSPTQGKDGTSHFGDLDKLHIVSPISMLGDLIPVMTGVAMAGRYLGQKIVAMTWIGDGGSSTGVFHEGLNFAATQKAPFVLILENNGWAYSTPVRRQVPLENLADRAKAYGIQSYIVDGNDVADVYSTTKEAVDRARAGEGPILIEAKTFRRMGHAQHDPAEYVPKEMREYWEKRDPILLHEKFLIDKKLLDPKTKKEIETKIDTLLTKDRDFAENSPMPPPEFAEKGVYCNGDDCHKIRAQWERPIAEVTPPKSSIDASWVVEGFGRGKGSGGGTAPIHFGDTPAAAEQKENEDKMAPAAPSKTVTEKVVKSSKLSKTGEITGPANEIHQVCEAASPARLEKGPEITMADTSKTPATSGNGGGPVTFLEAIKQAMFEEMQRDPAVVVMGEDVGVYGGAFKTSEGLLERFGWERVIDTPISESAIIGAACGMSYLGLRPICEMQFIDFIVCAFNQLTNFVAKGHYLWNAPAPIVVRGPSGGGVHGGPFHSANPEMYFVHTPGLKVIYPSTPYDAKGLLKAAVRDNNPVLFFEHKYLYRRIKEELPAEDYTVPIGKAAVRREGKHLTILSYAAMMYNSLEAADTLAKEGIEIEVIDLRTLLPLDEETILKSVKKTNRVLVVHEDTKTGGIAGEIAAILCEKAFGDLDGPVFRVTALDTPVPYSPPLEQHFLPNTQKIVAAAKELAKY